MISRATRTRSNWWLFMAANRPAAIRKKSGAKWFDTPSSRATNTAKSETAIALNTELMVSRLR